MIRLLLAFLAVTLALPADARPREDRQQQQDIGGAAIGAVEQALIREFYRDNTGNMQSLPPGIRKKVARGKPLPPGIAKKLPDGLHSRLPPRAGYDYRQVGADVMLVEAATGVIADILRDVVR